MRKILTTLSLAALILGCCARSVPAGDARQEKSLAALAKKINEVELAGERTEETRAWMLETVERASGALREGNSCEALKGLFGFRYHVSRFELIRRLTKGGKDHGELLSLAQKASRRIARHADKLGINCPGPY